MRKGFRNPFLNSALAASAVVFSSAALRAEDLTFSGTGTVRLMAQDWAAYVPNTGTFNAGANDGGRLYWRSDAGAGDGQYIHFDLTRLSGLTVSSDASVTLQNANPTWGASVTDSFIATANGAWTAASGAAIPGASAIAGASNPTGDYGSGASVTWGIGNSTFQGYVDNASSFNGLAIIGGANSKLHFDGPINPYLEVQTNASMAGIVTVSGGGSWNSGNYSFNNGVLTINDAVAGGSSGAGAVTINSLGTVFVNGNTGDNRYWAVDSTTINAGGVLVMQGHSHIHNLTLNGGELAGIRPSGSWGSWSFDDATTVTATSTISAQQMNFDNGTFNVSSGATLNVTGSIRSGKIIKSGAGSMVLSGANAYGGQTDITAGTLVAANNTALGSGGHNGATMTFIQNGATLALQGGISLDEHFHVWGSGVGGLGAVRSISGNNALTNSPGGGPGYCLRSNTTVGVDADSLSVSGFYEDSGSFGLTKVGAGTLTITAPSTYTGGTTISAGVLKAGNANAFGANNSAITVAAGTGLDVGSNWLTYNPTLNGQVNSGTGALFTSSDSYTYGVSAITLGSNASIGNDGGRFDIGRTNPGTNNGNGYTLTKVGNNYVAVQASGTNFAEVVINGGTLALENDAAFGTATYTVNNGGVLAEWGGRNMSNAININNGGTLREASGSNSIYSGTVTLSGAATVDTANGNITLSGAAGGTGSLIKTGGSTLALNGGGSQSFNGITVAQGILELNGASSLGGVTVQNGAQMLVNGAWNLGSSGLITIENGGQLTASYVANVINSGLVLKGGTVAGGATNGDWGVYNLASDVTANGNAISTISAELALAGTTRAFTVDGGSTLNVSGVIHNSYGYGPVPSGDLGTPSVLNKSGTGTMTLSGVSSYTGATLVSAGTLLVNGELGNTAVTVGSNGTIGGSGLIAGSLNFGDGAKLTVNLADPLFIAGAVTFDGFGFDDLVGFNIQTVGEGTYTLLSGNNFNFSNVANYGEGNAFVRNDGKLAYFTNGSLQVVVIPEPRAALLGGLGMLMLLRRRRS